MELHPHLLLANQCNCVFLLSVFLFFPCCLGVPVWLVLQLPLMPWSYYMYKVFQVLSQVRLSATPWLYFSFLAAGSICIFPYTVDNQKQYHTTTSCSAFSSLRRRFGEVLGEMCSCSFLLWPVSSCWRCRYPASRDFVPSLRLRHWGAAVWSTP